MSGASLQREELKMISDLVDGKLTGAERAEALRRIESTEALYEVFMETTRYRESRGKQSVRAFPLLRAALVGGLLAAALAAVVVVPRLIRQDPLSAAELARVLVADDHLDSTMSTVGWYEQGWAVYQGSPVAVGSAADTAFRIGVRMLDLEVAIRAGDRQDAAVLAARLESLTKAADSLPLALGYRQLAELVASGRAETSESGTAEALDLNRVLAGLAAEDPGLQPLELKFGRWCEAGRLAARSANAQLLESESFGAFLGRLEVRGWPPAIDTQLVRLRDLLRPALDDLNLAALESSFQVVIDER